MVIKSNSKSRRGIDNIMSKILIGFMLVALQSPVYYSDLQCIILYEKHEKWNESCRPYWSTNAIKTRQTKPVSWKYADRWYRSTRCRDQHATQFIPTHIGRRVWRNQRWQAVMVYQEIWRLARWCKHLACREYSSLSWPFFDFEYFFDCTFDVVFDVVGPGNFWSVRQVAVSVVHWSLCFVRVFCFRLRLIHTGPD